MRLTRLAARLRAHDWFAAAIELLIVVLGILIALRVSNWNQERLDRARVDGYYRRLQASLLADGRIIDDTVAFWRQVSNYGHAAMLNSETGLRVAGSNWKTVLAYYQASQLMPLELEDTTFVEMRDNRDLALIRDETLRNRISDYYRITTGTTMRANLHRHDPEYRRQIRSLTPWNVQQYVWVRCYRQINGTRQELIDCPAPIDEDAAARILDGYRRTDTLLPNLRFWMSSLRVSELVIVDTRDTADALARDVQRARQR
jgi:hypothetical protein